MTNLLTMFPVVFLLFAGLVDGSTVNFQATPASLEPMVTKQLTLVCDLKDEPANDNENQQSDFRLINSIRISRNGANIAIIDGHTPATKLGNNTGVVSGRFTGKGLKSQLQVSWAYPDDEQTGQYVCHVGGQNKQYQTVIVTKEIDIQKNNMNIQQMVDHMKALQKTVDKLAKPDVFFSTLFAQHGYTTIKTGQTLIYDKVFVNKGNGYSASTGEFICPVTGFYTFQLHGYTVNGNMFFLALQHNGKTVVTVATRDNRGFTGSGNTATLKLTQGDVVKVVGTSGSKLYYDSTHYACNTFSGRLISINN